MRRQKLYFSGFYEKIAYTIDHIIVEMKEKKLTECKVFL